jgi:S-adenosylmethionine synthetase
VRLRENTDEWLLEHVLVTIQHRDDTAIMEVCAAVHGDNGQTGRKLADDYYGPSVPIGGGALSGKDLAHIDRAAACALHQAAIHAVQGGAKECPVTGVWAPNIGEPLDVIWQIAGSGPRLPNDWFAHELMFRRREAKAVNRDLGRGRHFFDGELSWNQGCEEKPVSALLVG